MAEWQPIDFHGIVTLNKSVVVELGEYLEQKEAQLAELIAHAVHPLQGDHLPPLLEPIASGSMTLAQGVDFLGKRVKQCEMAAKLKPLPNDWQGSVDQIDKGLWDYIELLEGMVSEFFQQLDQIGFERWGAELIEVVEAIKALLLRKLKEVGEAIKRLDDHLKIYRKVCEVDAGLAVRLKGLFNLHPLDKDLARNIIKTEKFLGFRYQTFMHRVEQYDLLYQSTEQSVKKFDTYIIFSHFDQEQRKMFLQLYQWIRIWELNQTTKSLPDREPVRAIRSLQSPEKVLLFFREYQKALRDALFNRSRMIKLQPHTLIDLIAKIQHQHALQGEMAELHTLGTTMRKYRDFLLRTDPNPYISSRLGFGEWIVGPEPAIAKSMVDQIFDLESLDELFKKMMLSIESGGISSAELDRIKNEVQKTLHEMAQPLASYTLMLSKGKTLVHLLQQINELGSSHADVVDFVGEVLSRALRSDWKFHVLHEIPGFHEVFAIHQGIVGPVEDRAHQNRIQRFKKLIHQILEWVKNNDAHRHLDEIEIDVSDLKGYLQDFLAHIQRLTKDSEGEGGGLDPARLRELSNKLLEYRYLFGHFFHQLRRDKAEERVIRNQFLFVDQYFESVENKLQELRR